MDSTLLPIDAGPLTVCVQAVPTGMMGVSSDPVGVFVTFTIKVWWCLVFIVCYIYMFHLISLLYVHVNEFVWYDSFC